MKKTFWSRIGAIAVALILTLSFAACGSKEATPAGDDSAATQDPITWSYASNDAPGALRYDIVETKFAEILNEKTNGVITLEIYPSGSLSKPGSVLDDIRNGTIDAGQDSYSRYAGQFPYFELFIMPGFYFEDYDAFTDTIAEYVKEFPDAGTEIYKPIIISDSGEFGLASKTPITALADVKGKSIRNTPSFIPVFDKLGASSVDVSSGELYEALRLNTIDAVNTNVSAVATFKLFEVCDSFTIIPIERADFSLFLSQKSYDALTPELQKGVDEAIAEARGLTQNYVELAFADAEKVAKEGNPNFVFSTLGDAPTKEMSEIAMPLIEAKAKDMDSKGLKGTDAMNWILEHQSKK